MGDRWGWLRTAAAVVEGSSDAARARVVAGVTCSVARRQRVRLPDLALLAAWGAPVAIEVPDRVVADPWLLGEALEVLLAAGDRRRRGAHHTPPDVARTVVRLALGRRPADASTSFCDPAVGGGAFLLAAAEALAAAGVPPASAVRNLTGVDVDPVAVAVAEASLCLWAHGRGVPLLEVDDALARPARAWTSPSVVVGNPPFLGQLRRATARRPDRSGLRPDLAALAGPYTDTSALFAALATDVVAPGGRVALVLPRSFLVARDAGPAQEATLRTARLDHVWLPGKPLFGAAVDVCVPVWERSPAAPSHGVGRSGMTGPDAGHKVHPRDPRTVARSTGVPPLPAPPSIGPGAVGARQSWSHLLTGLDGDPLVPSLESLRAGGVLGDRCTATAGFRDQFYGLIPFTVDDPGGVLDDATHAPLVTSGAIDPVWTTWGRRPIRYAGRRWNAPRVDVAAVVKAGGPLARWLDGKRVPKLLVAAQTRSIEAVADVHGTWLPSTPVATVVPDEGMQWHVLAVLLSPVATAWAVLRHRGAGLNPTTVTLPPAALRALPTPAGRDHWDQAAVAVQAASATALPAGRADLLATAARAMCGAYGIDAEPATSWWLDRSPTACRP